MASDTAASDDVDTAHRMSPGRASDRNALDRVTIVDGDGGKRALAHDHGVHELHRHVARVLRELGGDAPHRGAGREPPGECEGGTGEIGTGVGTGEIGTGEIRTGLGAEATFPRRLIGHRALVGMWCGLSRTVPPNTHRASGVP